MIKHTPGPWTLETVKTSCGICHKIGPFPPRDHKEEPRHACLYADFPSEYNEADQELYANAFLIAAAPEMLQTLKHALIDMDAIDKITDMAGVHRFRLLRDEITLAIAKAEGNE